MTRVIKKSKKIKTESSEDIEKKSEGKDLAQAGNWFQKNKAVVTWTLVCAFMLTCIGFGFLGSCSNGNQPQDGGAAQDEAALTLANIQSKEEQLDYANPETLIDMAIAYQSAIDYLEMDDLEKNSDKHESKIKELTRKSKDVYKKAISAATETNCPSFEMAVCGLLDYYIQDGEYDEALKLAVKSKKIKELKSIEEQYKGNNNKEKVAQLLKKDVEKLMTTGTSPEGIELTDTAFISIFSNYVIACCYTNNAAQADMYLPIAIDRDAMNIKLYLAAAQLDKKEGKLEDAKKQLDEATKILESLAGEIGRFKMQKDILCVMELKGDIAMQEGSKQEAAEIYDGLLSFARMMKLDEQSLAAIKEKRKSTGVPVQPAVVSQEKQEDGSVKIIFDDGKELVIPAPQKKSESKDAKSPAAPSAPANASSTPAAAPSAPASAPAAN